MLPAMESLHGWTDMIELQPVWFYYKTLYPYLVRSLHSMGPLMGTTASNLVWIPNVEYGIQSVLQSIQAKRWATFKFAYGAVISAMEHIGRLRHISVDLIDVDDFTDPKQVVQALEDYLASSDCSLVVFEHITSPSAVLLPLQDLIRVCHAKGVQCLVDAAHAIGQLELHLDEWQPDYYVTNCHKWLCTPRGTALMYVNPKRQVHPLVMSWGYKHGLQAEFIWQGTNNYCPLLTLYIAAEAWKWLGVKNVIQRNQELSKWAGHYLADLWGTKLLVEPFGTTVSIQVPGQDCQDNCSFSDLHDQLLKDYQIEVPVFVVNGIRYLRVSLHMYNTKEDVYALGSAVCKIFKITQDR
ncbi:pyridoxal phosphate-dependent transferase [Gorgonomyces haynaldii]|nr:pyridoxal phosphate-dependent transferase [Gorgonomyces haynaldii]